MDLAYFEQWVLKEFKINLSAYKPNQLHRRILSLMSRVGVNSVEEYIALLKKDGGQRQRFLDFITINVTEFFRNPELFEELMEKLKIELLPRSTSLKIWSAACSIGSEPYSIAMLLDSLSPLGRHKIVATDIDATILAKAKAGEYSYAEVKNVKKDFLGKYFKISGDKYIIDSKIKTMITYKKHDLILEPYEKDLDLIV